MWESLVRVRTFGSWYYDEEPCTTGNGGSTSISEAALVAESPNLMPSQEYLSSIRHKYSRENTKLRDSVEHTTKENSKIHIFTSGSQMRE
jgi:hypothetical protein